MIWKQDTGDYSWHATDALGYFYRVQKVVSESGSKVWVTAWSESGGKLRIGAHAWSTDKDAKDHMNWIASAEEAIEQQHTPQERSHG